MHTPKSEVGTRTSHACPLSTVQVWGSPVVLSQAAAAAPSPVALVRPTWGTLCRRRAGSASLRRSQQVRRNLPAGGLAQQGAQAALHVAGACAGPGGQAAGPHSRALPAEQPGVLLRALHHKGKVGRLSCWPPLSCAAEQPACSLHQAPHVTMRKAEKLGCDGSLMSAVCEAAV